MYSIQTKGYSQWNPGMSAFRAIRAVVIEEMLHLSLARYLLVAVGGDITYYDENFIPKYPANMLSRAPALPLYLGPCSQAFMEDVFLLLEMPAERGAPPEPGTYHTLGQFYAAIEEGFKWLDVHHHQGPYPGRSPSGHRAQSSRRIQRRLLLPVVHHRRDVRHPLSRRWKAG